MSVDLESEIGTDHSNSGFLKSIFIIELGLRKFAILFHVITFNLKGLCMHLL
jgi:hypothetical protein